ncbi:peptidoglycan-binding protein [Nonomuraea sp. NPDC050556]|uniref:peptidoglycan-binding protein n=1 Tax=Nonomuraea sp. NPDC050556 TaxID=3364369 RepID=UPI0037B82243
MSTRTRLAVAGVVVAGVLVAGAQLLADRPAAEVVKPPATSLVTISRGDLSVHLNVTGFLGYAGAGQMTNHVAGIYTWLPASGALVKPGEVLYRVNGTPVVLLEGSAPPYRGLGKGDSGADVKQLNAALARLGYGTDPRSKRFSAATEAAVKRGVAPSGRLELGRAVFLPGTVRVARVQGVAGGGAVPGQPVMTVTGTSRVIQVNLPAGQQAYVKAGDTVVVTLPDGQPVDGKVTQVAAVAIPPSQETGPDALVPVEIAPSDPAKTGTLDQAPVRVAITTETTPDALSVPINALVALAGGGYAVEVVGGGGARKLVTVTPGMFDDVEGLVAVSGDQLAEGMRVVVPAA